MKRSKKGFHTLKKIILPCGKSAYVLVWNDKNGMSKM